MKKQECMTIDPRCLSQNLAICHIFYYFCDDRNVDAELSRRMLKYVKGKLNLFCIYLNVLLQKNSCCEHIMGTVCLCFCVTVPELLNDFQEIHC